MTTILRWDCIRLHEKGKKKMCVSFSRSSNEGNSQQINCLPTECLHERLMMIMMIHTKRVLALGCTFQRQRYFELTLIDFSQSFESRVEVKMNFLLNGLRQMEFKCAITKTARKLWLLAFSLTPKCHQTMFYRSENNLK